MTTQNKEELPFLTALLNAYKDGTDSARRQLWEDLFPVLQKMARRKVGAAGLNGRESPTELVTALYPGLDRALRKENTHFENRARFFSYVALSMRRQLVAQAAQRAAEELDENLDVLAPAASPALVLALERALDEVSRRFPRGVEAFMLRYYLGHSHEEIVEIMNDQYKTKSIVAADLTVVRKALKDAMTGAGA